MFKHIQQLHVLAASANSQVSSADVLREFEACLFMLSTVAKRLSPYDYDGQISSLISNVVLPGLASNCPPSLQDVGCQLYMELSCWAFYHPQLRHQIVQQLIRIVADAAGIENARLQVRIRICVLIIYLLYFVLFIDMDNFIESIHY